MTAEFEAIPTLESAGRPGRAIDPDSPLVGAFAPPPLSPIDDLGRLGVDGALEVADSLRERVFPSARLMARLAPTFLLPAISYNQHHDCAYAPYPGPGTCQQPCFGTSSQYMLPWYCATCAERAADPALNPAFFWHLTGNRGTTKFWGQHHACKGRAAWKWKINQACGSCQSSSVIRCHDGYKQFQGQAPIFTICEGRVVCDGTLQTCP